MVHEGKSEFSDNGWKVASMDNLLNRIHKTGTVVRQSGSSILHICCIAMRTLCSVRRISQKDANQLVRFRMQLLFSVQVCTG